ncbi:MAG: protein translocase SEC61 complex subunit gamma [Candidatus Methanomethylophilaceae archaeon]|nr:protein translocase SEC61 complex subunit gamma [Candidatus Methanomethylophilaceae archaeon]
MAEDESALIDFQDDFETKARGFGSGKYGRILKMAHTPTREEYFKTMYITGLGIIAIGAVGFAIWWVMTYLPTYF